MPGFDKEIARLAQRVLINPRKVDWHTGVLATKVTPGVVPLVPYWPRMLVALFARCLLSFAELLGERRGAGLNHHLPNLSV